MRSHCFVVNLLVFNSTQSSKLKLLDARSRSPAPTQLEAKEAKSEEAAVEAPAEEAKG